MNSIFLILLERLSRAFTIPDTIDTAKVSIAVGAYVLFSLIFGWRSGFLVWSVRSHKLLIARVVATSLIAPAILEEIFFRVLLLSDPDRIFDGFYIVRSSLSLVLFILYHPLNALTFFPQARKTFFDLRFLTLAAALGIVCTLTYWLAGSLWIPVLIHWITVVSWLLCFGGYGKLKLDRPTHPG